MFLFSKIIGLLINPVLWIIIMMVLALLSRTPSRKKNYFLLALLMTVFFSNDWVIKNLLSRYQAEPMPMKAGERYGVGVLLGGMAGFDENTRTGYFQPHSDRFIQALKLYRQGHIGKIIVTGGQANPFSHNDLRESDFVVENLVAMGVPRDDVMNERDSRNTIENAAFTGRIMDSLHIQEPFVLITSAYHMPRAMRIFRKKGIPVRPFPCDYFIKPSRPGFDWQSLMPGTSAFNHWSDLLKEIAGTVFLRMKGY
jgi:uncharacterized SAM-binding protein YcdF (DUF218 family)